MRVALAGAIVVGALAWSGLILTAPSWRTGRDAARATASAAVYALADRVCHQRPERSFALGGAPMPVCARCSGLYLSGAAGAVFALGWSLSAVGRRQDDAARWRWVLAACAVPTALSWLAEVTMLAAPTPTVRAICALPLGAVAGWICVRAAIGALR